MRVLLAEVESDPQKVHFSMICEKSFVYFIFKSGRLFMSLLVYRLVHAPVTDFDLRRAKAGFDSQAESFFFFLVFFQPSQSSPLIHGKI